MDHVAGWAVFIAVMVTFLLVAFRIICANATVVSPSVKLATAIKTESGMSTATNTAVLATTLAGMDASNFNPSCSHDSGFGSHC